MTMSEATPRRVSLAEAREARIHRPEAAAAYEQSRLRYELAESRPRPAGRTLLVSAPARRAGRDDPARRRPLRGRRHHSHPAVAGTPRQRPRADGDHQPRPRWTQVCLIQDYLTARTAQRGRELPCSRSLPRSIPSTGPRRQPHRPSARPHRRLTPLTPRSTATADQTRTGDKIVALNVPWRRPARHPTGTRGGNCSRCTARFCAPVTGCASDSASASHSGPAAPAALLSTPRTPAAVPEK